MTMTEDEFIAVLRIDRPTLVLWVESGWLLPQGTAASRTYSEADVARANLVADLGGPLGVNGEGIGIILDLVDQLHGLRAVVGAFGQAFEAQPEEVRHSFSVVARRLKGSIREL